MMTMEKAPRITEVVVEGSQRNCRMRRTAIAGLLLAGSVTAALAADPAAGQQIFKAQCSICHAVVAEENRIGPTLFGVVGRPMPPFADLTQ
jgi:cytochrome c2